MTAWQAYSDDQRGTPSSYLRGLEVGFADIEERKLVRRAVVRHRDQAAACADFIRREAAWVLDRR